MSRHRSKTPVSKHREVATLGGGCFWCTEAVFIRLNGVEKVEPGYCGGESANPTYEQVTTSRTGHAEVVQITFDPEVISFRELLEVFFSTHDPTTLNQQGHDVGTQYRSVIFHHDNHQKAIAEKLIEELNKAKTWDGPIVTQIEPFRVFYKAEDYHKDYFKHHPRQPYCQLIIKPKIAKLRKNFSNKLKN
ncbi:MAG: peptide-methionine (S)-S-oxide reductase MsrA [Candidatus Bathyarchaeota archaeon]